MEDITAGSKDARADETIPLKRIASKPMSRPAGELRSQVL